MKPVFQGIIELSQFCQPLYHWIQLDKKTYLSFGRHKKTEKYHFFVMTRQSKESPWEELCEVPREQISEEYPKFIKRVEESEEHRRKARLENEQHHKRVSRIRIF